MSCWFAALLFASSLVSGASLIPCDNTLFSIQGDGDYVARCPTPIAIVLMTPNTNVSSLSVSLEIFTPFHYFTFREDPNKGNTWVDVLNLSVTLSLSYEWTDSGNCTMHLNSSTTVFRSVSVLLRFNGSFHLGIGDIVAQVNFFGTEHLNVTLKALPGSVLTASTNSLSDGSYLCVDATTATTTAVVDIDGAALNVVASSIAYFYSVDALTMNIRNSSVSVTTHCAVVQCWPSSNNMTLMLNFADTLISLVYFTTVVGINRVALPLVPFVTQYGKFTNISAYIAISSNIVTYPIGAFVVSSIDDEIINSNVVSNLFGCWVGCMPQEYCGSFLYATTTIYQSNISMGGSSSWYSGPFRNVNFALRDDSLLITNGTVRIVADTNLMSTSSRQDLVLIVTITGNSEVVVVDQPVGAMFVGFACYEVPQLFEPASFSRICLSVTSNSLLSFARRHDYNASVGWLVSAGSQQSALAVDQLLVTIEGSTVVTPLSSWRQCAGPSSRLPRLPHMFSVDVAARSVGVSVAGSVIALVSAAAPDRVVLSVPMSVPRSFAAADARWADDGPLVPGNCTRTSSFVAPDVVVGFKVSRAATVSLPAVAAAAVLGVEVGSVALSLVSGSTAVMAVPVGVSATQMSLAASRLSLRCRDQSSGSEAAAGEGPLDNPLQMQLDSFTSPAARSAAGALTGNTVLWLSVSALDAVVTAVRELCTTKGGVGARLLPRVYQTIARRMPGLVASSFAVVHQPSLTSSLTLLISAGRTVLSGFFGAAGMLLFAGLPLWWSLALFLGVRRKRIAAVELVDSKRQQAVHLCQGESLKRIASFLVAPRWRWQPAVASDGGNGALFVAAYGSFFADFRRGCAMYFAFDVGITILTSLCVAIGLSLSVEAVCDLTAVANWVLFALGCVRLVTTAYLRPMSAPLANALAISFAVLSATSTLLNALGYDEGAMWSGAIEAAFLAASSVGTLILRLSVALWLKCDVKQHSPTAATMRRPLRTTYANDSSVAELSRLIETICQSRTAMKRI